MPGRDEVDWSPAELAQEARFAALDVLVSALTRDDAWIEGCIAVLRGEMTADELAGRYVRHGRGRAVLAALASPPERDMADALAVVSGEGAERKAIVLAQLNIGREAVGPGSPAGRVRWRLGGSRYREAAEMLVARGAGRCETPGCGQALADGRPYCSAHISRSTHHRRADQDAIRHLLTAAGRALTS